MGRIYVREELADDGRLHENFPIENQHWYEGPRIELQKVCRSRSVDVNDDLLERNPELRESDIGTICPYMILVHFAHERRPISSGKATLTGTCVICV